MKISTKIMLATLGVCCGWPMLALSEPAEPTALTVTVNSNLDGPITADESLTLREAIALQNGMLSMADLSATEKAQVIDSEIPAIEFDLPAGATTVEVKQELPAIVQPDLVIDGTSQEGYQDTPVVAIAPVAGETIGYGLAVKADRVTIKGLSLYGFVTDLHDYRRIEGTPQGDIVITAVHEKAAPPEGVLLESNWLGISPDGKTATFRSSFGVTIFNAIAPTLRNNRIDNHDGSGILTSVRAPGMNILDNILESNGLTGMADGMRLEGDLTGGKISGNTIRKSGGSAIYLFKSSGAVQIVNNTLENNGDRLQRGAIFLMGKGHQVQKNIIRNQNGSGVVIASYPRSSENLIQDNQFSNLKGLSIDLVTYYATDVANYGVGDGPNPQRNSDERRKDTGNAAVNAPSFLAPEFTMQNAVVKLDGKADPGSEVVLYRAEANDLVLFPGYATPTEALVTVKADAQGRFAVDLTEVKVGDRLTAIAIDPRYGTSEPAAIVSITGSF
jgi:hypothetical protein